jgi:hypothetical protein
MTNNPLVTLSIDNALAHFFHADSEHGKYINASVNNVLNAVNENESYYQEELYLLKVYLKSLSDKEFAAIVNDLESPKCKWVRLANLVHNEMSDRNTNKVTHVV